ncbi:CdvA-like protein [[Eubacterium] cellulosolvens]
MMTELSEPELKGFFGKQISDTYGRRLGTIIGVTLNDFGEMQSLELEKGNNELQRLSVEQISMDRDKIIAVSEWKIQIESLLKEMDSAQRRLAALSELLKRKEIPKNLYDELTQKHEEAIKNLKLKKSAAIEIIQNREKELDRQIEDLTKILIELKAGKWSEDFSSKVYDVASNSIEPNLEYVAKEKRDLADHIAELTKLF